ncbi:hypothetical protein V6N12_038674 [Hibiscus sabdariffa]|uniref:Uncharacterized protein n=1 Tax=Hibiscus sabdariffa TaxID=183260 RepID=A0ABR2CCJ1_9ROSI
MKPGDYPAQSPFVHHYFFYVGHSLCPGTSPSLSCNYATDIRKQSSAIGVTIPPVTGVEETSVCIAGTLDEARVPPIVHPNV